MFAACVEQVVVARRREVGRAAFDDFVDRDRHRTILEERLFEVKDVVGDDLGACRSQFLDAFGKGEFAVEGGGEIDMGRGCQVMDDLRHRPSLVRSFSGIFLVFEHGNGRGVPTFVADSGEVSAFHVVSGFGRNFLAAAVRRFGRLVEGVGKDADGDPAAVDTVFFASRVGFQLGVALRDNRAGGASRRRRHRREHRRHPGNALEVCHGVQLRGYDRRG